MNERAIGWRAWFTVLIISALGASCAGGDTATRAPLDQTPTDSGELPVLSLVEAQITEQLNITLEEIDAIELHPTEWSNGCLEMPAASDVACTEALTPGYVGTLEVGDRQYEVRSNADGSLVILIPDAALSARQALAEQLGVAPSAVQIISVEPVQWPDGCLGAAQPGEMCTQAITPGYRVLLDADGERHEMRTDETGGVVRSP